MTYLDTILLSIFDIPNVDQLIPSRNLKILLSLSNVLKSPNYITENQARLSIKLLKEHKEELGLSQIDFNTLGWKYNLRVIEKSQRIYIHDNQLIVESRINKKLHVQCKELLYSDQYKHYYAELTEANIVLLVETLTPLNFEIDSQVIEYYNIIKTWKIDDYIDQFQINNFTNINFQKQITEDLGLNTSLSLEIIADRSHRYQYFCKTDTTENSLTDMIAYRKDIKIWIDNKKYSLIELIESLITIKRLPILFLFSSVDPKRSLKELTELSEALRYHNINDHIGVYYRLPNSNKEGKEFNQHIAVNGYNSQLTKHTTIVGIPFNKLPKFFIDNEWKPMSIVSINHSLTSNKTSVYANCCDLIISYSENAPLITGRIA